MEPFTGRDLHRAHGVFVAAAADAKEERCRRQNHNDRGEYGRLYHRVMEPALQRGRYDAPSPKGCLRALADVGWEQLPAVRPFVSPDLTSLQVC